VQVRELSSDVEIAAAYPLARELRDRIQPETFLAEIRRQQAEGYRLYGGFDEDRLAHGDLSIGCGGVSSSFKSRSARRRIAARLARSSGEAASSSSIATSACAMAI
jgi:hypothetical protein